MTNLADFIERFIQQKLSEGAVGHVLVRRNELADELSCAPSQISYVLSTRFTLDRGYLVESRRGSGGFVRIARLEPSQVVFAAQTRQEQDDEDFEARHAAAIRDLLNPRSADFAGDDIVNASSGLDVERKPRAVLSIAKDYLKTTVTANSLP